MQEVKNARVSLTGEKSKPTKLKEVSSINYARIKTDMDEFNRVLGGGVVPGSLVLIGGDPGIGKSTLLLQVSTQLANKGTVLYVSGEESAEQIKLRSERLGDIDNEFYLYAETNMQAVRSQVEAIKPDFLIIDSIQTIMSPEISGVQGSVSQVREVTAELMQIAKTNNSWLDHVCWNTWWILCSILRENVIIPSVFCEQSKTVLVQPMRLGFLRCSLVVW